MKQGTGVANCKQQNIATLAPSPQAATHALARGRAHRLKHEVLRQKRPKVTQVCSKFPDSTVLCLKQISEKQRATLHFGIVNSCYSHAKDPCRGLVLLLVFKLLQSRDTLEEHSLALAASLCELEALHSITAITYARLGFRV